jgi:hypothetical protein
MAQRSLYLCFPIENLKNRIKLNCIAQFCCPFKSIQFRGIAEAVGVSEEEVPDLMVDVITEGLLVGRLDLVTGTFHRFPGQEKWNEKRCILDDAVVARVKMEEKLIRNGPD